MIGVNKKMDDLCAVAVALQGFKIPIAAGLAVEGAISAQAR